MNSILKLMVLAILVAAASFSTAAEPTLKADLKTVVETGQVTPVEGLTTAGQPDAAAFKVFAEQGYVAVIDLRTEGEDRGLDEPAVVSELGMEYVNLPITGDDITFEKAEELAELLGQYDGPVLLRCGSANRVGALLALDKVAKGVDAETAIEEGKLAGLSSLEGKVRAAIDAK